MSDGFSDWGSKDDQARRRSQKKAAYNNQFQCPQQAARFERRMREDEAFARELGCRLRYEDLRR